MTTAAMARGKCHVTCRLVCAVNWKVVRSTNVFIWRPRRCRYAVVWVSAGKWLRRSAICMPSPSRRAVSVRATSTSSRRSNCACSTTASLVPTLRGNLLWDTPVLRGIVCRSVRRNGPLTHFCTVHYQWRLKADVLEASSRRLGLRRGSTGRPSWVFVRETACRNQGFYSGVRVAPQCGSIET